MMVCEVECIMYTFTCIMILTVILSVLCNIIGPIAAVLWLAMKVCRCRIESHAHNNMYTVWAVVAYMWLCWVYSLGPQSNEYEYRFFVFQCNRPGVLKIMGQHLNIITQVGAIFSTQYSVVAILMCARFGMKQYMHR